MFKIPVLLIIFNRPGTTQQVYNVLKQIKPKKLFVAADGPRKEVPEDIQNCHAARAIFNNLNWDCDLKTLFRDENRGCGYGPAEAITWFFKNVDEGIILEDDCLPSVDFFDYCNELLGKYRENKKVTVISGLNLIKRWKAEKQSYIFSRLGGTWGWATWRDRWQLFEHDLNKCNKHELKSALNGIFSRSNIISHYLEEFEIFSKPARKKDVWDFHWLFARFINNTISIVPTKNLISNIGFNEFATHTINTKDKSASLKNYTLKFPLVHPKQKVDKLYDRVLFENLINRRKIGIFKKIILKLIRKLKANK